MPDNPPDKRSSPLRVQVANLIAILIGLALIGVALYGAPLIDRGHPAEIRHSDAMWSIQFLSGSGALAAVILAQWNRWLRLGRALAALAGLLLFAGLAYVGHPGWRAWLTLILPGALLVALGGLIGPFSEPAEPTSRREL
jgi:hypothetical protein